MQEQQQEQAPKQLLKQNLQKSHNHTIEFYQSKTVRKYFFVHNVF